jgi:Sortase domain
VLARTQLRRWPAAALIAGIVLAGGAAAGYAATRPPGHDYGAVPAASAAAAPADRAVPPAGGHRPKGGLAAAAFTAVPVRLKVPAIGVDARVVPVGVAAGGALGIPASPSVVGWWAGGGSPGQRSGATVLVGHVDSAASGPGALFRLQDIRPGAAVTLTAGGRAWRYAVRAVRAYVKAALPSAAVFGQQVTPRLVIITCGGPFDAATGHYLDNIVAWAAPA